MMGISYNFVTSYYNSILSVLLMLSHLLARQRLRPRAKFPRTDVVGDK